MGVVGCGDLICGGATLLFVSLDRESRNSLATSRRGSLNDFCEMWGTIRGATVWRSGDLRYAFLLAASDFAAACMNSSAISSRSGVPSKSTELRSVGWPSRPR